MIQVSINNEFNPETVSNQIAECIKTQINVFDLKLECAVDGLTEIDRDFFKSELDKLATAYRN